MNSITPVVKNLLIINVILFVAIKLSPPVFGNMMPLHNYNSDWFQPFQFVTSMFTHYSLPHLLFNMIGLYFFGPLLEQTVGPKKTLIAYLVGGLISAGVYMLYYAYFLNSNFALLGASGALYTILVITALYYPKQPIQLIFPPIRLTLGLAVAIYIAIDVFMFLSGSRTGIANLAHLGGAFAGVVLYFLWNKR